MYKKLLAKRQELEGKEGGFTLIELLVVVVIIGILVAIAIPLYLHFENGAKASGAASDVHGITSLVKLCQSDNGGTLPASGATSNGVFSFTLANSGTACDNDTYNVSTNDDATYALDGNGGFTVTVVNSDSQKTWIYTSADGSTVES